MPDRVRRPARTRLPATAPDGRSIRRAQRAASAAARQDHPATPTRPPTAASLGGAGPCRLLSLHTDIRASVGDQGGSVAVRGLLAIVSAILVAGGLGVALNTPAPIALGPSAFTALAVIGPSRSARIIACIIAALLGLLFASAGLRSPNPLAIPVPTAVASVLVWFAAWRVALSPAPSSRHTAVAALTSAAALSLLYRALSQVGSEGGFCWLPGLPVGCLP